jgi:hypothetical protein
MSCQAQLCRYFCAINQKLLLYLLDNHPEDRGEVMFLNLELREYSINALSSRLIKP